MELPRSTVLQLMEKCDTALSRTATSGLVDTSAHAATGLSMTFGAPVRELSILPAHTHALKS